MFHQKGFPLGYGPFLISPEKDLEISFTYKQGIIGISWSDEKYLNTQICVKKSPARDVSLLKR